MKKGAENRPQTQRVLQNQQINMCKQSKNPHVQLEGDSSYLKLYGHLMKSFLHRQLCVNKPSPQ